MVKGWRVGNTTRERNRKGTEGKRVEEHRFMKDKKFRVYDEGGPSEEPKVRGNPR